MSLNKSEVVREIARRSRATLFPLTVDQATVFMNHFVDVVTDELLQPEGRLEMEGFVVLQRSGNSARAKISPMLKRRIRAKADKGEANAEKTATN